MTHEPDRAVRRLCFVFSVFHRSNFSTWQALYCITFVTAYKCVLCGSMKSEEGTMLKFELL